jgi:hypothetical protein
VIPVHGEFHESSAEAVARSIPLAHVSVELGHLYPEDLREGPARLRAMFAEAAPWASTATAAVTPSGRRARISTCFLVDDYFAQLPPPAQVIPELLAAAQSAGLRIDYLAREAACAATTGPVGAVSPAAVLGSTIVDEPPPGSIGVRPPAAEAGWLCNGVRPVPARSISAMEVTPAWEPPRQSAARRHCVFVDVQLWDDDDGRRTYSCPMLAAVWQLLRLGMLRDQGQPLVEPLAPPTEWPQEWSQLPAVVRLNPSADPFTAYTTVSVLAPRFLPIEAAVRIILGQVRVDAAVLEQLAARAGQESFTLADEIVDRIGYAFAGRSDADPA